MNFKNSQQKRQEALIEDKFFDGDNGGGLFRGKNRPFVLQDGKKNLYHAIRQSTEDYFNGNGISWWGGKTPTGNTLSSQIACLNHLFPIRCDAKAVRDIINNIKIDESPNNFIEVLKIPSDKEDTSCARGYIAFEVVSDKGHLNEKQHKRGSNCTSIDALVYAVDKHNEKWILLIEWKYTEFYNKLDKSTEIKKTAKGVTKSGDTRMGCYNDLIEDSELLIPLSKGKKRWPDNAEDYKGSVYYQEPFYQLMRQTLWAEQMIAHKGEERIKADHYLHIHVIPNANETLLNKGFKGVGDTMKETWKSRLTDKGKERHVIIDPADLMEPITHIPEYKELCEYLAKRYW